MSNVLSQDEVDALLKGVKSGDVDTEAAGGKSGSVTTYDLTSQERIVRGRMPGLEMANERFTRFFRNSISTFIMKMADINVRSTNIVKFGEFMKTLPIPSSISIVKMEPLKGYALLVMEAPLVFAFVELFFGGSSAKNIKSEGRSFTSIEQRIIKKVATLALADMAEAWSGIAPITPEHVNLEINPQFVTIVTPSEIVIKVEIGVEIDSFTGKLFFCIPYSTVESIREKLYSGIQTEKFDQDHRWVEGVTEILMTAPIHVSADVGALELTFGDLMNLHVGDVLTLNRAATDELTVRVEDVPKFNGVPGYSRGNQSIKITKVIT